MIQEIDKKIRRELNKLRRQSGLNLFVCCGRRNEQNRILTQEFKDSYIQHTKEISKLEMLAALTVSNEIIDVMKWRAGGLTQNERT